MSRIMASPTLDEYRSDSDLGNGLPSPDASDDEDIKTCQDHGIIVPHFLNKLRILTLPLYPKPAPVVLSDLLSEEEISERVEIKKKTPKGSTYSHKNESDVSLTTISHNGSVASPRWTKSPSVRPYEPCGITGDEDFELAGVVFRKSASVSSSKEKSYSCRESDFPSLNESSQSDLLELSKSTDASLSLKIQSSINEETQSALSPPELRIEDSVVTSTPTQYKRRSMILQESPVTRSGVNPLLSSHDKSPCSQISDPGLSSNSQSNQKSGKKKSKRQGHSSLAFMSPRICDVNANNSTLPNNNNSDPSKRNLSPVIDGTVSPVLLMPGRKFDVSDDGQDVKTRGDSKKSCAFSKNSARVDSRNSGSPSWSHIVKTSPCLSPVLKIHSPENFAPEDHSPSAGAKVQRSDNAKRVSLGEGKDSPRPGFANSGKKTSERKQRVQLMPVDNTATPKKSENNPWSMKSKSDISAFENRFVAKIAISTTSPPKKVNPSPIKKLDFCSKNKDSVSGEGTEKESGFFRRQVSLISDLEWKKCNVSNPASRSAKDRGRGGKMGYKPARSRRSMFSSEDHATVQNTSKTKDEISTENIEEVMDRRDEETKIKVDEFWSPKCIIGVSHQWPNNLRSDASELLTGKERVSAQVAESHENEENLSEVFISHSIVADVKKVTMKVCLRKYARRYCHFVEGHLVTNISREILFILQLLTCCGVESQATQESIVKMAGTPFESVHNCVYFAVKVIKRLKGLFSCLSKETTFLLASHPHIVSFSPTLCDFFKDCLSLEKPVDSGQSNLTASSSYSSALNSYRNWINSFSDTKMAHVFKCQRDNLYALYQRYQDSSAEHPIDMNDQIHYVYDREIAEHDNVISLMHLSHLFVDLLLQFSLKHVNDQVEFSRNIHSEKEFQKWKQLFGNCTFGSPPRWNKVEQFFQDFIQSLRCPAFNELLKNTIVSHILELNGADFEPLKSLHSTICLPDDMTPKRCETFTNTVRTLCILGKMLGHLVFAPYAGGEETAASVESCYILTIREKVPLPLPLPQMLKQARKDGRLCVTVPWVVQYLSMMDPAARKLSAYSLLLDELHSIHRYSWSKLYKKGHSNTGLLLTSCISWLFENPALPAGWIYSHHLPFDLDDGLPPSNCPLRCLDTQRVVTSQLLHSCCPFLNAGRIILVMFASHGKSVRRTRRIIPLTPVQPDPVAVTPHSIKEKDVIVSDICSKRCAPKPVHEKGDMPEDGGCQTQPVPSVEALGSYNYSLGALSSDFLKSHPFMSHCVSRAVELMCGKVQDYAFNTTLKLGMFEARVKVRRKFIEMDSGQDADSVKGRILAKSNIMAQKMSQEVKNSFFQLADRVCDTELPNLIHFLASHVEEPVRVTAVGIAQKALMSQLIEWAKLQLDADFFRKAVRNEAEKVGSTWSFKPCSLYPTDYLRKPEYNTVCNDLSTAFQHHQQLSKVLDAALACGSWYMNGQTRGPRPDDAFIHSLMEDFMACINNHNVSMDFSFPIMINFLVHLIMQYIVDAPQNWTDKCVDTFIQLCVLFESKRIEDEGLSFQPLESAHKAKKMKLKMTNIMSVFSLSWLARSPSIDHSLMIYCHTLVKLVQADVLTVETVVEKLTVSRCSHHLSSTCKLTTDRIVVKVLEMLYTSSSDGSACSTDRVISLIPVIHHRLIGWGSDKAVAELKLMFGDVLS